MAHSGLVVFADVVVAVSLPVTIINKLETPWIFLG